MAISTCVKCGGMHFEMKENTPSTSRYKLLFVQCSNCGGVVGVVDFHNIGDLLHRVLDKVKNLK